MMSMDALNSHAQFAVEKAKLTAKKQDDKISTSAGSFVDSSRLNTEENLDQALEKFEAIFVRMMLKSAREATESSGDENSLFSNSGVKQFRTMQDDQWADAFANSSNLGIAEALKRQLAGPKSAYAAGQSVKKDNEVAGKTLNGAMLKQHYMLLEKQKEFMSVEESNGFVTLK